MDELQRTRSEMHRELSRPGERPAPALGLTRRTFLHRALLPGAAAGAYGWFPLINSLDVAHAQQSFKFAWVSDTYLYPKTVNTLRQRGRPRLQGGAGDVAGRLPDLRRHARHLVAVALRAGRRPRVALPRRRGDRKAGMACAMCRLGHPSPRVPTFQEQMNKFAALRDMINWCIEKPNEGVALAPDSDAMKALEVYIIWSNKGSKPDAGRH